MPYNGTGTFNRIYSWVTDAANGILVRSDRMDTDTNDIASGLSNCITRDGQSPPTAAIPMGSQKITGLANGTVATDAMAWGQVFSGTVDLSGITELKVPAPVNGPDAATKTYADTKGAIIGQAWTGSQDFTGATATVATATAGDNSTKAASTAFVIGQAFNANLPNQAGNAGKTITTNGTTASWSLIGTALQTIRVNAAGTALEGYVVSVPSGATIYTALTQGAF